MNWITLFTSIALLATPMVSVPAGEFTMGPEGKNNVFVETFAIDRHEVTNAEFATVFPEHAFREGAADHPVTNITWHEARDYCQRLNKRLPSDSEWEKAARGTEGFNYPWGNKAPRKKPHPFYSGVVKKNAGSNKKDLSPYGVYDMAGSVWEWTGSSADSGSSADAESSADGESNYKIVRGGLWNLHLDFEYSQTHDRIRLPAGERYVFLGFRCARSEN